jgi:hypothetical protein
MVITLGSGRILFWGTSLFYLRKQDISLLSKWWWKLDTQKGLWHDIIKAKYLRNKTIATVTPRFNDSPVWKVFIKVKDTYSAGRKNTLENGDITRMWKDPFCVN